MHLELMEGYGKALERHEAFWSQEIIDRPPVFIRLRKPNVKPFQEKVYSTSEERWLDVEYRVEQIDYELSATEYLYDAVPVAFPNLGPEIFSAWCGCGYEFGPHTTWSTPCIHDWEEDIGKARINMLHPLFSILVRFTELLIERGKGRFIVGLTDFHPGGDHLAALRDPMALNIDMIENVEWVDEMLLRSSPDYFAAYGVFYHMLRQAGMPITSWIPLLHNGSFYIPSNDFSCMISKKMFDDHFLPGIIQECKFYERSIYHLDGPDALRHLDSLLDIKELDAIQWVCGSGNEGFARWRKVYQRIQASGKSVWLDCNISELDDVFASLKPNGVAFGGLGGVRDKETADAVVKRIANWK